MRRLPVFAAVTALVLGLTAVPGAAASDKATVKKLVLVKGDAPKGWKTAPGTNSSDAAAGAALAQCVGVPDPTAQRTARRAGVEFSKGDDSFDSTAVAYKTKKAMKQAIAVFDSPKSNQCLQTMFAEKLAPTLQARNLTMSNLQVQKLEVPRVGDARVGVLVTATISDGTSSNDLYIVTVLMRKGRFGVDFTAQTFEKVLSQKLGYSMLRKLDAKLDAQA
jgi:hypothetical protein